ncbi:hypothetical protein JAAARDRAFT_211351 [Jaapia argillacea MUCL 33604]|uniref:Protein UNC80 C-terminal domain-containing protein n=1 Tax=Jaapia argillacea MUCL 33604 TaxID=933084 RepID=A0A067P828_9AGAM|nr:hypothetical protein JAAARDRAFT_211351 [Jaapia argillacea MUCL 33604]
MSSSGDDPKGKRTSKDSHKRPSGGRPLPRRLLSLDSDKDGYSSSESEKVGVVSREGTGGMFGKLLHGRDQSKTSTLRSVEENEGFDPFSDRPFMGTWTEKPLVESPNESPRDEEKHPFLGSNAFKSGSMDSKSSSPTSRFRSIPPNLNSTTDLTKSTPSSGGAALDPPPPSPSKRRWEQVRQQFLLSAATAAPRIPGPSPSGSSFGTPFVTPQPSLTSLVPPPTHPSTPKPSRFARLGWGHTVERVRQMASDDAKKFEEELRRACWFVRFGGIGASVAHPGGGPGVDFASITTKSSSSKLDTPGSSLKPAALYKPFISTTSLPYSANSSTFTLPIQTPGKYGMRRPQSVQSLGLAGAAALGGPSVKTLRNVLIKFASPESTSTVLRALPFENEVLSALLVPFLDLDTSEGAEQERLDAIDGFEVALKTWPATSQEAEFSRCLWCCKAASMPPSRLRVRIIGVLDRLLSSSEALQSSTPMLFQTLVQELFVLLPSYTSQSTSSPELKMLKDIVGRIRRAELLALTSLSIEQEYGISFSKEEGIEHATDSIFLVAVMRCMQHGSDENRRWILQNVVKEHWPPVSPFESASPLLSSLRIRQLNIFISGCLGMISLEGASPITRAVDAEIILRILQTRAMQEVESVLVEESKGTRAMLVELVLTLLCIDVSRNQARDHLCSWYGNDLEWKIPCEDAFRKIINDSSWPVLVDILGAVLKDLPDDKRKSLVGFSLPLLHDRLVSEPPRSPSPAVTGLLDILSRIYPPLFFKPLFLCAASSKQATIVKHLRILTSLSNFLPDFWTRDPEMMSVVLMLDARSGSVRQGKETGARLGQMTVLLELIQQLRQVREGKSSICSSEDAVTGVVKFALVLDARIGVTVEAKEQKAVIPPSQRLLFVTLFLEIRLLTRSLKGAPWLPRIVLWTLQVFPDEGNGRRAEESEVGEMMDQIREVYHAAKDYNPGSRKRKSTLLPSTSSESPPFSAVPAIPSASRQLLETQDLISLLSPSLLSSFLKLLVAVSGLLSLSDYRRLAKVLWGRCLDESDPHIIAPACFLVMQCAEKLPEEFLQIVRGDIQSCDKDLRRRTIERLGTLAGWRFQILSQEYIVDINHRRPFKLVRPPMAFVPTDMGTSLFIHSEDPEEYQDISGNTIPQELRKRLSEIGWTQDEKPIDQKLQWQRMPMSILPNHQLDRLNSGLEMAIPPPSSPNPSPTPSPQSSPTKGGGKHGVTRKGSSSGSYRGVKRRAVFVHPLVSIFPDVAILTHDADFTVARPAQAFIMEMMRNEPALLCRPVFDTIAGDEQALVGAITTLRMFLHIRRTLPPSLTHHIFNHLAGFLKLCVRLPEESKPFEGFAHTVPILSKLASQVGEVSIREIRRAKFEVFVIPSGSLWFSSSTPEAPMFPRRFDEGRSPFDDLPAQLVWITMIRVSQNMLFVDMIKRSPQDVQTIRKKLSRFALPSLDHDADPPSLELTDFVPRKSQARPFGFALNSGLTGLSLILSRSYLLLIAQIFRSMSRHLNDRDELSVYTDGLNRILLAHGDDIGIVGQAMIALMTATTRFQRLFKSGSGYTLFMPVVIKVYTESESHSGIRAAIEYALNRFFALHDYAFIFQSMSIMAHIISLPNLDNAWIAKGIFYLFSTLKGGVSASGDAAGIHNINKRQEKEALMISTAEEKPQAFLASLRRSDQSGDHLAALPDEYEGKRLSLKEFTLFFINFIAEQDATHLRAEQFLRFLTLLAPHLYQGSTSARHSLHDGIEHIGGVLLTRTPSRAKIPESALLRPVVSDSVDVFAGEAHVSHLENRLMTKSTSPSDIFTMRVDYLCLVAAFTQAGGQLSTLAAQRVMELLKLLLKDSTRSQDDRLAAFISNYTKTSLIREPAASLKEVTSFLLQFSPVVSAYASTVDLSGFFQSVCQLAGNSLYSNEPAFGRLVVNKYCAPILAVCHLAASEDSAFDLPWRPAFIALLQQAVSLVGADVITELESFDPSYGYLSGVIFPMVIGLRTSAEAVAESQWAQSWRRDVHSRAWVRLLSYTLSACDKTNNPKAVTRSSSLQTSDRPRFRGKVSKSAESDSIPRLALSMQILKIIVTKAADDLSASLPGIWPRISSVILTILWDGDASFALQRSADRSVMPTPTHSPRASATPAPNFDPSRLSSHSPFLASPVLPGTDRFSSISSDLDVLSCPPSSVPKPRIVDYLLWSFLEWVCCHRSPLSLQLRLFVQEKTSVLAQQLGSEQEHSLSRPRSRRFSSAFVKPRRIVSSFHQSATPSPEASPMLTPTLSSPNIPDTPQRSSLPATRRPGFSLSPSPSVENARDPSGLRIVHLGPVRQSFVGRERSSSPGAGVTSASPASQTTTVKSILLVRNTYRRVRLVQHCMGYEILLPCPEEWDDDPQVQRRSWTRAFATNAIVAETRDLMDEFAIGEGDDKGDPVATKRDSTSST